jgi:hypothetical protein
MCFHWFSLVSTFDSRCVAAADIEPVKPLRKAQRSFVRGRGSFVTEERAEGFTPRGLRDGHDYKSVEAGKHGPRSRAFLEWRSLGGALLAVTTHFCGNLLKGSRAE